MGSSSAWPPPTVIIWEFQTGSFLFYTQQGTYPCCVPDNIPVSLAEDTHSFQLELTEHV